MTMRAIQFAKYGGPEQLKLEQVPIPKPKDGQVLIKVHSAGVNPVDTYIRAGDHGSHTLPMIPGYDAAGIVDSVGAGVTDLKKGDRVYTCGTLTGAYAEYTIAPAENVAPLDKRLSFAQGASIGVPYYTAYKALHLMVKAKPGETVLIHGASGAVGIAAVQIAIANGQKVLGTAGTKEGMELVKKLGADLVFNHREDGYIEKIKEATKATNGPHVILEMLANVNLNTDLEILPFRGRVVIIGSRGEIKIDPMNAMFKEISIVGIGLMSLKNDEWGWIKAGVEAGQRSGWLNPVVAKEYKLSDAAQSHKDVIHNTGTFGKLVLDVTK